MSHAALRGPLDPLVDPLADLLLDPTGGRPVVPATSALRPLGLAEVRLTDGFWADRQAVNAANTLAHIDYWLEREGWLGNFRAAATGDLQGVRRGREFSDSEVYKFLEAMAWELGRQPDAALAARYDEIVDVVAAAQESDGYLNTKFGRPGQEARYSDFEWGHELYCYGHLLQAAVARGRTGGVHLLVDVARRVADHICETFGPDANQGICGHPEIEPALAEFGRMTGEQRYIDQAALFVERRGHGTLTDIEFGRSYFQDDEPVREATVFHGHAVRATYLAAGAIDVAVERGDTELLDAVTRQWETTIGRRTYVTGGMGSRHQDEAFGEDFVLPPDRAYSETCAGIGSIMVAWRLLLNDGSARYADLIERTLFNVVATSPAADGRSFYYTNTLQQRSPGTVAALDESSPRATSSLRAPWFEVSCCPPNVARTFASLATYVATVDESGVQLHQYAASQIRTTLPDGVPVALDVVTDYPVSGHIEVRVPDSAPGPGRAWTLDLRVPQWSATATLTVTSADGTEERAAAPGTMQVTRAFAPGDVVRLELDLTPRFTAPDPRIDAVRGCVAVERGPEVLCVESVDVPGVDDVGELLFDARIAPREECGQVVVRAVRASYPEPTWPYTQVDGAALDGGLGGAGAGGGLREVSTGVGQDVVLIRYHDWANRGPSTMRVWLPQA